jgi:drug/metabolite transporter (DMT)-like permease
MHALFGAAIPISKMLLTYTTPFFFTSMRMLIAGVILLLLSYKMGYTQKLTSQRQPWWMFAQIIVLGFYMTYICRFWGLSQIPSSKAAFFFNASPFITAIYVYILDNERLNKMQWLGLMIGLFGLLPILITSSPQEKSLGELFIFSWGELAVLFSVAFHCYGWIMIRKVGKQEGHHPILLNAIALTFGGLLALATAIWQEPVPSIPNIGYFLGWLMIVVLLSNLISHNIYGYLQHYHYSPTFLSFTNFLGPIFSAFYAWLLLDELITWHFGCATMLIFVGLYLFYREELSTSNNQQEQVENNPNEL